MIIFKYIMEEPAPCRDIIDKGMDFEKSCEIYLIHHNIPYKKNITLCRDRQFITEFDLIIPGAIIEAKSGEYKVDHILSHKKLLKQITTQLENIPKDYIIYVLFERELDPLVKVQYEFNDRIKVIHKMDDIKYIPFPYCIIDTNVLRSFASTSNPEYKTLLQLYPEIITTRKAYNRSIVMMDEEEKKRFDQFNIIIQEEIPKRCVLLHGRNVVYDLFDVFIIHRKYHQLRNSSPLYELDSTSMKCNMCQKIHFIENIVNGKCYKCNNMKRRKYVDSRYISSLPKRFVNL